MAIPEGPDLVAVSAHKIHGPKGIGALWMRDGAEPAPFIHGGGQERGMRSGTLSPALCVGFGAAAKLARSAATRITTMSSKLWDAALAALGPGWTVNGSVEQRYRGNLNIRRDGLDAARLIADLRDIAFSLGIGLRQRLGAAEPCAAGARPVDREARSSIRLGFGRYTSEEELVDACKRIDGRGHAAGDARRVTLVRFHQGRRDARQGSRGAGRRSACSTSPGPPASRSKARARA